MADDLFIPISELEALGKWVRDAREYNRDDSIDEIARAIENRVRLLKRTPQPHPDTVRLEWLEADRDRLHNFPSGCTVRGYIDEQLRDAAREAIDHAMGEKESQE